MVIIIKEINAIIISTESFSVGEPAGYLWPGGGICSRRPRAPVSTGRRAGGRPTRWVRPAVAGVSTGP
jgi:hypothetical protein